MTKKGQTKDGSEIPAHDCQDCAATKSISSVHFKSKCWFETKCLPHFSSLTWLDSGLTGFVATLAPYILHIAYFYISCEVGLTWFDRFHESSRLAAPCCSSRFAARKQFLEQQFGLYMALYFLYLCILHHQTCIYLYIYLLNPFGNWGLRLSLELNADGIVDIVGIWVYPM